MAATNRYMNFGLFSFASVVITGITDFGYDPGISEKRESSDADLGTTVALVDFFDPGFTLTTLNALALQAVMDGTKGTFIATLLDAYNKATTGGGAKLFTTNALSYLTGGAVGGKHREYMSRQIAVRTMWADSVTPPISITSV